MVQDSKIRGLKFTVEVTPGGHVHSKLEDHKGQRGSSVSGNSHNVDDSFGSLEGQARFLVLQEARRSLRAGE